MHPKLLWFNYVFTCRCCLIAIVVVTLFSGVIKLNRLPNPIHQPEIALKMDMTVSSIQSYVNTSLLLIYCCCDIPLFQSSVTVVCIRKPITLITLSYLSRIKVRHINVPFLASTQLVEFYLTDEHYSNNILKCVFHLFLEY